MNVKELIELLQKMPQDLPVYVMADHGQLPQAAYAAPEVCVAEDLTYFVEDYCTEESGDAEEYEYEEKFVLI